MLIDAGRLDRQIDVLAASTAVDAAGQPLDGWTIQSSIRGGLFPLLAREVREQAGRADEATQKYLVRWRADIATNQRVQCDGRVWQITGTQEIGRREGLWLLVSLVDGEPVVAAAPAAQPAAMDLSQGSVLMGGMM